MFLETIKVKNKIFHNLEFHQRRLSQTQEECLNIQSSIFLEHILQIPENLDDKLYKCRVVYDTKVQKIEFLPYQIPTIKTLKIIKTSDLAYQYKYLDRNSLTKLYQQKENKDDIIISQNGLVQDSYYGNLLFWNGNQYFTPKKPLLKGTQRAKLLKKNKVIEKEITVGDIRHFTSVKIINAMLDLKDASTVGIENVF